MYELVGYHRPTTIEAAVSLLGEPNRVLISGGTTIIHDGAGTPVELVDLQALGLADITVEPDGIRLGAMTRLEAIADSVDVAPFLQIAARAELPSSLRTLATVGGTIGSASAESLLLTALLAADAEVRLADGRDVPLATLLGEGVARDDLIVSVRLPPAERGAIARTGRTPADDPIVAAVGVLSGGHLRMAISGVATVPIVVTEAGLATLDPPGDFRGSSQYRRHLAAVLFNRVTEELT